MINKIFCSLDPFSINFEKKDLLKEKLQDMPQPISSEFDEQKRLWLAWTWGGAKKNMPYFKVIVDIIKALSTKTNLGILYNQSDDIDRIKSEIENKVSLSERVSFIKIPVSSIWIRDTGPSFVKDANNKIFAVQFGFKEWGYSKEDYIAPEDEADYFIVPRLAKALNLPIQKSFVNSEGGNRETNGKGVLIVVEDLELERNPGISKEEIEAEYKLKLGIKKVIWLPFGLAEDGKATKTAFWDPALNQFIYTPFTPGGHIDEFCRFVDSKTILLAKVPDEESKNGSYSEENAKRLEICYKILKDATDQDGNPFTIIRVPTGPPMRETISSGDLFFDFYRECEFNPNELFPNGCFPMQDQYEIVVSTSYLNFVKINNTVLIPSYWEEGMPKDVKARDDEVCLIFKQIYPDCEVLQINSFNVNVGGGGLHCMTLNEPKYEK